MSGMVLRDIIRFTNYFWFKLNLNGPSREDTNAIHSCVELENKMYALLKPLKKSRFNIAFYLNLNIFLDFSNPALPISPLSPILPSLLPSHAINQCSEKESQSWNNKGHLYRTVSYDVPEPNHFGRCKPDSDCFRSPHYSDCILGHNYRWMPYSTSVTKPILKGMGFVESWFFLLCCYCWNLLNLSYKIFSPCYVSTNFFVYLCIRFFLYETGREACILQYTINLVTKSVVVPPTT